MKKETKNNKTLESKAIDIKGKKYVLVADRVTYFNDEYPNGSIQTTIVENTEAVVVKAKVTPDHATPERYFTAYSQAVKGDGYINRTSALENAETSAIGRALGFMGIGVIESIASVDEINKANTTPTLKTGYMNTPGQVTQSSTKTFFQSRAKVTEDFAHLPSVTVHGEIDEANKTFNAKDVEALTNRQK